MLLTFLCCHYLWTLRSQSQSDTDIIFSFSCCRKLVYDSVVWSSPVWFLSVDSFLPSFSITEILLLKFLGMSGTSHVTIVLVFFILPKHFHTVSSRSVDHLSSALSVLSVLFLETHSFQHSFWVVTMWYIAIIIETVMVLSLLRPIFHLHLHTDSGTFMALFVLIFMFSGVFTEQLSEIAVKYGENCNDCKVMAKAKVLASFLSVTTHTHASMHFACHALVAIQYRINFSSNTHVGQF